MQATAFLRRTKNWSILSRACESFRFPRELSPCLFLFRALKWSRRSASCKMFLFIDEATFTCELWRFYAVINGVSDREARYIVPGLSFRFFGLVCSRWEPSQLLFEILIQCKCGGEEKEVRERSERSSVPGVFISTRVCDSFDVGMPSTSGSTRWKHIEMSLWTSNEKLNSRGESLGYVW